MPSSTPAANRALDGELRRAGHIGLLTVLPDAAGEGWEEPSGGGYARVSVTSTGWTAAAARESLLQPRIDFPDATADWGTVRAWGWFVSGELSVWERLTKAENIDAGTNDIHVPANTLRVRG